MKPLQNLCALAVVALSFTAGANSLAQNLITNGGFESGNFTGWSVVDTSNNTNVGPQGNPPSPFQGQYEGTRWANLGADSVTGVLSQVINTTPGIAYTFSFALAVDQTGSTPDNFFRALFGSTTVFDQNDIIGSENGGSYTPLSYTVTATGNTTEVRFEYQHNNDYFRLDAVSVVPEPSTVSLIAIATAGGLIGLYRRSRRNGTSAASDV